jgi:hypothetical protein
MFTQSPITEVFPPRIERGQAFLSWSSSAPAGTWFQVYVNGALSWYGQRLWTWVPIPAGPVRIDIGAVLTGWGEDPWGFDGWGVGSTELTDWSSALPAAPSRRAELAWQGGTFEGADLAGFHVYGEAAPGGGIDYTHALATITAYPAGITTDGWGLGGYGSGGWGAAAGSYSWTSGALASGTWHFAVRPFDQAGNEGTTTTTAVTITAPPREPAVMADGVTRLVYTYSASMHKATLTWLPSAA